VKQSTSMVRINRLKVSLDVIYNSPITGHVTNDGANVFVLIG